MRHQRAQETVALWYKGDNHSYDQKIIKNLRNGGENRYPKKEKTIWRFVVSLPVASAYTAYAAVLC